MITLRVVTVRCCYCRGVWRYEQEGAAVHCSPAGEGMITIDVTASAIHKHMHTQTHTHAHTHASFMTWSWVSPLRRWVSPLSTWLAHCLLVLWTVLGTKFYGEMPFLMLMQAVHWLDLTFSSYGNWLLRNQSSLNVSSLEKVWGSWDDYW